jgi:hypothetical protein
VARDLDFLRDEERAPLAYDDARHGFRLTDEGWGSRLNIQQYAVDVAGRRW